MAKMTAIDHARIAAKAADEKQGVDVVAIDVRSLSSVTECFLFVGATSHIHVKALEDAIREKMRLSDADLRRTDGQRGHPWRVLDYGTLIVHIMEQSTREFYSIERLWNQGKQISLTAPAPAKKRKPAKAKAARASKAKKK